ncbi:MAG: putative integral rane protein [Paenibacillus sp.]|jgi:putative membrane protein|nr:putative integral rane protein [Paenibacillus sp.]
MNSTRGRDIFLQILLFVFIAFWGIMAVSPTDRMQWLLENILVIVVVCSLCFTFKKFRFTNTSYFLLFVFLCLHTYAAHYTYQGIPVDMWLKSTYHTQRSYFDRFVHFMFGLILIYPVREFLTRVNATVHRGFWSFAVPIAVIVSLSTIFEVIEMLVALVAGQIGEEYAGLQGDKFDSEKDMALSLTGAILTSLLLALISRKKH